MFPKQRKSSITNPNDSPHCRDVTLFDDFLSQPSPKTTIPGLLPTAVTLSPLFRHSPKAPRTFFFHSRPKCLGECYSL